MKTEGITKVIHGVAIMNVCANFMTMHLIVVKDSGRPINKPTDQLTDIAIPRAVLYTMNPRRFRSPGGHQSSCLLCPVSNPVIPVTEKEQPPMF